jgi:hypothetical protein
MSEAYPVVASSGSRWHRWDPHMHAPGTILNDQFGGEGAWDGYLTSIETATPTIRALGVTDYYVLDLYQRVQKLKAAGRLPQCDLIFPNVEMRLTIGTARGNRINVHLLVSPEDPDHIAELSRFLTRLTFKAFDDVFPCTRGELIRLGRRADPAIQSDEAALRHGVGQFKVDFEQLRSAFDDHEWARKNILVAVAAGSNDGTSGMKDAADATQRAEVEKFADVIFSSNPKDHEFWLGRGSLEHDDICSRYGALKPCLHGSDAHKSTAVGVPDGDRFTWIKGDPIFDTLRQACIVPDGRAYVGATPPIGATQSQLISGLSINGTSCFMVPTVMLNPGLIAVIGARGSGKTALADIIAAGCDATPEFSNPKSFLNRARDHLHGASVRLDWESGEPTVRALDEADPLEERYPRARYLSQQFVEELCTSDGVTDALLSEVKRVIFEAHDSAERDGAIDFDELLDLRATRFRQSRDREEQALAILSDRISDELQNQRAIPTLTSQVADKGKVIARYIADREKLLPKGNEERTARLAALNLAAERTRARIRSLTLQSTDLLSIQDEVSDFRKNKAPDQLRDFRSRHLPSGLKDDDWSGFLTDFKGSVDGILAERLTRTQKSAADLKGVAPLRKEAGAAFIAMDADLDRQPLAMLEAEIARLEALVSADRDTQNKYTALSKRIADETAAQARLKQQLDESSGAADRLVKLLAERQERYIRVFEAVLAEQAVLVNLYAPLMVRLASARETLKKLSFSVSRVADVDAWALQAEELLDLRVQGPFRGRGKLKSLADATLKDAWERGDAAIVAAAMAKFRKDNDADFIASGPDRSNYAEYRNWARRFARWLYGTDHISLRYSVDYDGVDIRKLSPGTRGIVLLLLYLALDDADDRPLIIDQPEENLDPKSIYDELVGLFTEAKNKRQVVLVTHNANLVVNTDADQIIVASAGPHAPGELPPITYVSGGLESAHIRKAVCDILEGGERAFRERAKRLRLDLAR